MRLVNLALVIVLALAPCGVFGQGGADNRTPMDGAPGWLIVFAGGDDAVTQQNVIRACMVANFVWQLPTDHVLVLARGADVENFVKGGDLPAEMGVDGNKAQAAPLRPGYAPAKTEDLIDVAGPVGGAFKLLFNTAPRNFFPYSADATADYFRIGRDVIARIAQPGQFVAFITIANGETLSGNRAGFTLVPRPGDHGKQRLAADDFKLTDCRASVRLFVLAGRSSADVPDFAPVLANIASGGDKETVSAVFANWAAGNSAANAYLSQLLRHLQSGSYERTTLQDLHQYAARDSLQAKSVFTAQPMTTSLDAAFCLSRIPIQPAVPQDNPPSVELAVSNDSYFNKVSVLTLGSRTLLSLPGAGSLTPEERGDIIKTRLVGFLERLKSEPDALLKIKLKPEQGESWGLYTDDGMKLVTADPDAAKQMGVTPRELVADLETQFKVAFYKFLHQGTGYPEKLASNWYVSGRTQYNLRHWSKAAAYYSLAVKAQPTYIVAHFGLIDALVKDGQRSRAASALKTLMAMKLDADARRRIVALRKRNGL